MLRKNDTSAKQFLWFIILLHCGPTKPSSAMSVAHLSIEASYRKQAILTLIW